MVEETKVQYSFPWNGSEVVYNEYIKDNYKVMDYSSFRGGGERSALIFFSSHALYFPNDENNFVKKIVMGDKYEWNRIGHDRHIKKRFERVIWVRDIYKQWYVEGINIKVNSMLKLGELLSRLTLDYGEIVLCGTSAGGYAACVIGTLIRCTYVISISGQISLFQYCNEKNPLVMKNKKINNIDFFDINECLKYKHDLEVFYLYSGYCERDIYESGLITGENVKKIAFESTVHGQPFKKRNSYIKLLNMEENELRHISEKYKNSIINENIFRKKQ